MYFSCLCTSKFDQDGLKKLADSKLVEEYNRRFILMAKFFGISSLRLSGPKSPLILYAHLVSAKLSQVLVRAQVVVQSIVDALPKMQVHRDYIKLYLVLIRHMRLHCIT